MQIKIAHIINDIKQLIYLLLSKRNYFSLFLMHSSVAEPDRHVEETAKVKEEKNYYKWKWI